MRSKSPFLILVSGWLVLAGIPVNAAELLTLFTTPSERQLINSNRYKTDEEPEVTIADEEEIEAPPIQFLIHEEVTRQYTVSGVSLSREGDYTVWINSQSYEDGGELEDNSKVEVLTGEKIRVRITTPDGSQHYALSGETLDVTYMAPIKDHVDLPDPH